MKKDGVIYQENKRNRQKRVWPRLTNKEHLGIILQNKLKRSNDLDSDYYESIVIFFNKEKGK